MTHSELLARLGGQSLRRQLTKEESALSEALLEIFATGQHDFAAVAAALQQRGLPRPTGEKGPWTIETLQSELAKINASLDAAYEANDLM